MEAVFVEAT